MERKRRRYDSDDSISDSDSSDAESVAANPRGQKRSFDDTGNDLGLPPARRRVLDFGPMPPPAPAPVPVVARQRPPLPPKAPASKRGRADEDEDDDEDDDDDIMSLQSKLQYMRVDDDDDAGRGHLFHGKRKQRPVASAQEEEEDEEDDDTGVADKHQKLLHGREFAKGIADAEHARVYMLLVQHGPGFFDRPDPVWMVFPEFERRQLLTRALLTDEEIDADLRQLLRAVLLDAPGDHAPLRPLLYLDVPDAADMVANARVVAESLFGMLAGVWWSWARRISRRLRSLDPETAKTLEPAAAHRLARLVARLPATVHNRIHPLADGNAALLADLGTALNRFVHTGGIDTDARAALFTIREQYLNDTAETSEDNELLQPTLPWRAIMQAGLVDTNDLLELMNIAWAVDYVPSVSVATSSANARFRTVSLFVLAALFGNVRYAVAALASLQLRLSEPDQVVPRRAVLMVMAWAARHAIYEPLVHGVHFQRVLAAEARYQQMPGHDEDARNASWYFNLQLFALAGESWGPQYGLSQYPRRLLSGRVIHTLQEDVTPSWATLSAYGPESDDTECHARHKLLSVMWLKLGARLTADMAPLLVARALDQLPVSPALFHSLVVNMMPMARVFWCTSHDIATVNGITEQVVGLREMPEGTTLVVESMTGGGDASTKRIGQHHYTIDLVQLCRQPRGSHSRILFWDALTLWSGECAAMAPESQVFATNDLVDHLIRAATGVEQDVGLWTMPLAVTAQTNKAAAALAHHASGLSLAAATRMARWWSSSLSRLGVASVPWWPQGTLAGSLLVVLEEQWRGQIPVPLPLVQPAVAAVIVRQAAKLAGVAVDAFTVLEMLADDQSLADKPAEVGLIRLLLRLMQRPAPAGPLALLYTLRMLHAENVVVKLTAIRQQRLLLRLEELRDPMVINTAVVQHVALAMLFIHPTTAAKALASTPQVRPWFALCADALPAKKFYPTWGGLYM